MVVVKAVSDERGGGGHRSPKKLTKTIMTADLQTFGFPPGYFIIRSVTTQRLWDVKADEVEDGTEIALWPEKDNSLVEGMSWSSL